MTREEKLEKIDIFCNERICADCKFDTQDFICNKKQFFDCTDEELDEVLSDMYPDRKPNNVNNPAHYTQGNIECIDAIKASMKLEEFRGFLKGNVIKYIWRYADKGKPTEDLKKAEWYLKRLIEEVENDEK